MRARIKAVKIAGAGSLLLGLVALLAGSAHLSHSNQTVQVSPLVSARGFAASGLPVSKSSATAPIPCRLDRYGGFDRQMGQATGFFHIEKIENRWWLIDPLGNPFWMRAIYNVERHAVGGKKALIAKYGSFRKWSEQVLRRMLAWGFNATGEYSENAVRPYGTYGGKPPSPKVAAIAFRNISPQAASNSRKWLTEPVHDIIAGVPTYTYKGWRGILGDIYDPDYAVVARKSVEDLDKSISGKLSAQRWIVGVTLDDADDLYGFKGEGKGGKVAYPHPAFMVLCTNPTRKGAHDPKVYSKYALRDFLRQRYGTLEGLNSSWGSRYTSWDTDGGFATGSGLLDEDGNVRRHPWVGSDPFELSNAAPVLKQDMEDFLFEFATHYFRLVHDEFRKVDPNHLLFGPASLGAWGGRVRQQVLRAGTPYVDVWQFTYDRNPIKNPVYGDPDAGFVYNYDQTGKPVFVWTGQSANPDSTLHKFPNPWGMGGARTQEERAQIIKFMLERYLKLKGSDGNYFVVGYDFWSWGDHGREKSNWGLVTFRDNAYDGKEAVRAPGTDPWGYATGGEENDYGDFLTIVSEINHNVYRELGLSSTSCQGQLPAGARKKQGEP